MRKILVLLLAFCAPAAIAFEGDVSATVGYMTDYHFRGIHQKENSAFAGVEATMPSYFGTEATVGGWAADVGDGAEIDAYGSIGFDVWGFSAYVGGTVYSYTGDFDKTYKEGNAGAGFELWGASINGDYAHGKWDGDGGVDYNFYSITAAYDGVYVKYGEFGKGFSGDYVEVGFSRDWLTLELGGAAIITDEEDSYMLYISKTFE